MSQKQPVAVTKDEFLLILSNTKRKYVKVVFLLGFGSGLRLSEIVGYDKGERKIEPLHPDRIDVKSKTINVIDAKGGAGRTVPLAKGFKEDMLKFFPITTKYYKNIASARRSIERMFKSAARKAGVLSKKPDLHFHSLRHGFGTRCADQGMPIHHIKMLMGHSNISTTNVYIQGNPKDALREYEGRF
jgi:integrase